MSAATGDDTVSTGIVIREATPDDIPAIYRLILELAEYEKALDKVENTEARLLADGFGTDPLYTCFVAEDQGAEDGDTEDIGPSTGDAQDGLGIIGIALVYFRYSTWKGRCLYLEDLIVTRDRRGEGLGKALLLRCVEYARETGSRLMIWQVLDWNTDAIEFYKSLGAELQPEWVNCVLPSEAYPPEPS